MRRVPALQSHGGAGLGLGHQLLKPVHAGDKLGTILLQDPVTPTSVNQASPSLEHDCCARAVSPRFDREVIGTLNSREVRNKAKTFPLDAPAWVKKNTEQFPRARLKGDMPLEILAAFSAENLAADCRAFARLMAYLREHDGRDRTVIMVQVENEVAMLEEARDTCHEANQAFAGPVPRELLLALQARKSDLLARNGARLRQQGASWTDVFGEGIETEEIFQAYYYAVFINALTLAGKREHDLPMYVNAALNRPGLKPGQYPSAGPLPHLFDIWKVAAPALDFLSPDVYFSNFEELCKRYQRPDNHYFVPEAGNGPECVVHALYAIGACRAFGFIPSAVEGITSQASRLPDCYRALKAQASRIRSCREQGKMGAVTVTRDAPSSWLELGGYRLRCAHDFTLEWSGPGRLEPEWPKAGVMVLAVGPDEFLVIGSGVIVTFEPSGPTTDRTGILFIEELAVESGRIVVGRRLNGDESHQGRHLRIPARTFGMQTIGLYRYH